MRTARALLTTATLLATLLTTIETQAQQRQRAGVSPSARQPVQRSQPRTVQRAAPTPRIQQPRVSQPRVSQPRISQPRATPQPARQSPVQRSIPRAATPRFTSPRITSPTVRSVQPSPQFTTPRTSVRTPGYSPSPTNRGTVISPRVTPRTNSGTRVTTPGAYRTPSTVSPVRRSAPDTSRSVTPRYRTPDASASRTTATRRAVGTTPNDSTTARLRYLGDRARARSSSGDAATSKARAVDVQKRLSDHYGRRLDRDLDRVRVDAPSSATPRASTPRKTVPGTAVPRAEPRAETSETRSGPIRTRYTPTVGTPSRNAKSARVTTLTSTVRSRTPKLNAGERIQPRLQPRSAPIASLSPIARRGAGAALAARRSVVSHAAWGSHYATLSFAFGSGRYANWGCYSYPFSYCSTLPFYYQHCYSTYRSYRRSCYSGFGLGLWWWPRHSYLAGSWLLADDWCWYDDDPYDYYYRPGPSYVVIRERSEPSAVVVASAPASEEAAPSVTDLATRHLSLGDYYFREGRFGDAAESYLRALAYAPDDGALHFLIADALFAQGDYHYAAHMIAKGVELDAELVRAVADKREFYGDPASFEKQLATLRTYLDEKPYDAAAHLVLGYNLHFSADPAGAVRAFERVLEIDPTDPTARAFLAGSVAPK